MRRAVLGGLMLMAAIGSSVAAQEPFNPRMSLGGNTARNRDDKERVGPSAEYLIFQRARHEADQRAARLEMYRWMGYSPQRPTLRTDPFATDLNPGLYGWGTPRPMWNVRW
jgi:hypothetical protein